MSNSKKKNEKDSYKNFVFFLDNLIYFFKCFQDTKKLQNFSKNLNISGFKKKNENRLDRNRILILKKKCNLNSILNAFKILKKF